MRSALVALCGAGLFLLSGCMDAGGSSTYINAAVAAKAVSTLRKGEIAANFYLSEHGSFAGLSDQQLEEVGHVTTASNAKNAAEISVNVLDEQVVFASKAGNVCFFERVVPGEVEPTFGKRSGDCNASSWGDVDFKETAATLLQSTPLPTVSTINPLTTDRE